MEKQMRTSVTVPARRAMGRMSGRASRQGGFIVQMVLIGIVLIGLVMAYIARSSKGSSSQTDGEQAKLDAQSIVKIGTDLQTMSQRFAADHNLANMTLDTTAGTGLYDPAQGLGTEVQVPGSAMVSGSDTSFTYDKTGVTVTSLMTNAAEYVVRVDGVKDLVCQHINRILYGVDVSTAIPATVGTRQEGCASIGASSANVYYKVVRAN